jgi:hypothetical protein
MLHRARLSQRARKTGHPFSLSCDKVKSLGHPPGKGSSLSEGFSKGQVNVGGKTLEYNAYKMADGTINVGRITVQ